MPPLTTGRHSSMEQDGKISGIGFEILTEVTRRTGDKIHISRSAE